jgi:hypothetical protein
MTIFVWIVTCIFSSRLGRPLFCHAFLYVGISIVLFHFNRKCYPSQICGVDQIYFSSVYWRVPFCCKNVACFFFCFRFILYWKLDRMMCFNADGPAEDLYGIFINRVRRERGEEVAHRVKGCITSYNMPILLIAVLLDNLHSFSTSLSCRSILVNFY